MGTPSLLTRSPTWLRLVYVVGFLYLFLLGIGTLGGSFKSMGAGYTEELLGGATGPVVSLFIGILATTLVQSSSTTTSMVVALVGFIPIVVQFDPRKRLVHRECVAVTLDFEGLFHRQRVVAKHV